ncbi:class E sortase [Nakamurella endophytica]|uniref:Class E sortase n=1 Tax=Nakamurella endophytica TaxID=1748367 RepID=A0A917SVT5_9ACTN|nr:class E sortase [Nakamurella endophytica]GGM00118.1 class E sortase [Nakamurella endophytica]
MRRRRQRQGPGGDSPEEGTAPSRRRDVPRLLARGVGQTLITLGVVVLLFVVYEVYVTDLFSGRKQDAATAELDHEWSAGSSAPASGTASPSSAASAASSTAGAAGADVVTVTNPDKLVTDPGRRTRSYETSAGQGFAKLYIPVFGPDYVYTVIEGTDPDDLDVGPGHYADTQYPGEQGNFAVAGHRVSKGSPFNQLGQLSSCDALVVETAADWFVYRVLPMQDETAGWKASAHAHCAGVAAGSGPYRGVFGREITDPADYAQVLPVPHRDSTAVPRDAQRMITLTTCHPQFSDAQRMIIHGVLVRSYRKADGFLPPELQES